MKERVQKLMAQAGVGSRRENEAIIRQGRVKVNGQVIQLGDQADPRTDIIEVDGQKLDFPDRHTYIAFNKPKHVLSTDAPHKDDRRKMVRDYVPFEGHLFAVGRLDADSEGLMVLTDDGDLANRLSHPRYRHTKTYKVVVYGLPTAETLEKWQTGIFLDDEETGKAYKTAPCSVQVVDGGKETTLRIIMTEGKKRQIRRVASALGHPVKSLVRTHIGRLALGVLRPGEWRELTAQDVQALKSAAPELRPLQRPARKESSRPPAKAARRPEKPTQGKSKSGGGRSRSKPRPPRSVKRPKE